MTPFRLTAALALALLPASSFAADIATEAPPTVGGESVPGDFNGDSNPDLLWQNQQTRELSLWLLSRTRPVGATVIEPSLGPAGSLFAAGTADFNGDGHTDLVMWDRENGDIKLWLLDRNRVVGSVDVSVGLQKHMPVSVFDFNRDGHPDILLQGDASDDIIILVFDGTTLVAKEVVVFSAEHATDWRVVGTGDFDRDGDHDLVLHRRGVVQDPAPRDADRGAIGVGLMNGLVASIEEVSRMTDSNWTVSAVSDFTRDGWPDLYFQNAATGATAVWEMQGLNVAVAYVVTSASTHSRGWHIVGPK